jgi:hypothetical protein
MRIVIEFDPQTGGVRVSAPPDVPLALYALELARDLIKANPPTRQALELPPAGLAAQMAGAR